MSMMDPNLFHNPLKTGISPKTGRKVPRTHIWTRNLIGQPYIPHKRAACPQCQQELNQFFRQFFREKFFLRGILDFVAGRLVDLDSHLSLIAS